MAKSTAVVVPSSFSAPTSQLQWVNTNNNQPYHMNFMSESCEQNTPRVTDRPGGIRARVASSSQSEPPYNYDPTPICVIPDD